MDNGDVSQDLLLPNFEHDDHEQRSAQAVKSPQIVEEFLRDINEACLCRFIIRIIMFFSPRALIFSS